MPFPRKIAKFKVLLDQLNLAVGKSLAWLSLVMVLTITGIVLVRKIFGHGSIAVQESVTYAHATLFMLCMAFNLQQDGHVRVDVFYHRFSEHARAWINALGALVFLLPFALFMVFISSDFVARTWEIKESSADPGGLPIVYLLKTLIPAAGVLLALQAISQLLESASTLLSESESEITRD